MNPSASPEPTSGVTETDVLATHPSAVAHAGADDVDARPSGGREQAEMLLPALRDSAHAQWLSLGVVLVVGLLVLCALPPLSQSGIWDPYELNNADLARRVGVNLHGAQHLALSDTDNTLPHLNDLGRPQLPFTLMALGFKFFGLHDWAGRLPLALVGLLGALATYAVVARLVDRRAGVFSAVALLTMPLYFVQARTMLGDIVPMAALPMSLGGLLLAMWDRSSRMRASGVALFAVGAFAGVMSRGLVLGLGVPTLAAGLAHFISRDRDDDVVTRVLGAAALACGGVVAYLGYRALELEKAGGDLSLTLGAMVRTPSKYPTFDIIIGHLGPSLAPWSALAPVAMGRLFRAPSGVEGGPDGPRARREVRLRAALLIGTATALFAHAALMTRTDLIVFTAPALLACAIGVAVRDYERGAPASVAVGVVTVLFLALFHHDFHGLPEKAYQPFGITGATFPDSFKDKSLALWTVALIGFAAVTFFAFLERTVPGGASRFREVATPFRGSVMTDSPLTTEEADALPAFSAHRYVDVLDHLRRAWDGTLSLLYFAAVAGASLAALIVWGGTRAGANFVAHLSTQTRMVAMNGWWVAALVPLAIIFGFVFALDAIRFGFAEAKPVGAATVTRFVSVYQRVLKQMRQRATDEKGAALPLSDDTARLVSVLILGTGTFLVIPILVAAGIMKAAPEARATLGLPVIVLVALATGPLFWLALAGVGDTLRGSRAAFVIAGGAALGGLLAVAYYPALTNQLSPKEIFDSYRRYRTGNEPLGLFGVGGKTAAYYAGEQPVTLVDTTSAYQWLSGEPGGPRRFVATRADDLARLNQLARLRTKDNLPVVDGRSSQILLASSSLLPGRPNENPLARIVRNDPPRIARPMEVNLDDKLTVLGLDITDADDKAVDAVTPLKKYHIKTYYRVLAPLGSDWEAFIHIDGYHRRHNGDHKPCGGKYPMTLWLPGDLIVDDYEFSLEPNFTPGDYTIYFGFWLGESRLKVKSGPSDGDNRINGGALRVR